MRTVNISVVTKASAIKNRIGKFDILIADDDTSWIRESYYSDIPSDMVIVGLWGFQTCQNELTLFNFILAKSHW